MSEFFDRPGPTPEQKRISIFLLMLGLIMVLNLMLTWVENILGITGTGYGIMALRLVFSMGYYVFPILIAWQLPQSWIRITTTILFSIFAINTLLGIARLPTLHSLFENPEKFTYFNF